MSEDKTWVSTHITPTELHGKKVEIKVFEERTGRASRDWQDFGIMRIEPHPKTSGLVRIRVVSQQFNPECFMIQIEAFALKPHPDPSKADYLCELQYAS